MRMIMKSKQIRRRFTIKMVEQVIELANLIQKKGGVHPVLLLRQIIAGIPLRLLQTIMG